MGYEDELAEALLKEVVAQCNRKNSARCVLLTAPPAGCNRICTAPCVLERIKKTIQ